MTYSDGVYTAGVELDGQPYTDQKAKTVTLTFDMGGKCDDYVITAQVGTALMLQYMNAIRAAQAEGFRIAGFTPGLPESYTSYEELSAVTNSVYMGTVPETDTVYYASWNAEVTPAITVGGLKCGASLPSTLPEITPAEPDKYYIPEEPDDTDNVCPWCGETHDKSTFIGFFTEFIHDILYVIRQIFFCFV